MRSIRIAAISLTLFAGAPALAADVAATEVVSAPAATALDCAGGAALSRIQRKFAWAEHRQWHWGFTIAKIGNPRPSGHSFAEPGLVDRDFCMADAIMSDGSARAVYYTIEHGLGFVGFGAGVDFCVPGLDPWHVHDGDCRTVR